MIIMEKAREILAKVLEFTTGYGFYGLGFVGLAVLFWFLGYGWLGWLMLGAFIGKNLQAIREHLKKVKW